MSYGRITVATEAVAGGFLGGRPSYRFVLKSAGRNLYRSDANYRTAADARAAGVDRRATIRANERTKPKGRR